MAELTVLDFEKILDRLLLSQYKKPNFRSLFKIMSQIFTDIQSNSFELRDKFWLEDATGEQLDFIGGLWDENRTGQSDTDYRVRIYNKVGQSSSGSIQEIKNFLYAAYGATYAFYSPEYPAGYRMRTDATITNDQLESITVSGVGGFSTGMIVDAVGNPLVDAFGNNIIHVSSI